MIKGTGVDIVEIPRIAKAFERASFVARVCTPLEIAAGERKKSAAYWAGRWAAKEAFAKALGCGIGKDCRFQDIEITNDVSGAPRLNCSGAAAEKLKRLGANNIHLSISHSRDCAVAMVIIEGEK